MYKHLIEDEALYHDWQKLEDDLDICRLCPRLVSWREEVAQKKRRAFINDTYWGKPVPGFGDKTARLLVVGLAPGAHGSNRTGRMFTGDASGDFLFPALYRAGFASQPKAIDRNDGIVLKDIFITAVCRCVPPGNKPTADEIENCRLFLLSEMALLDQVKVIVALGKIAFDNVLKVYHLLGYKLPAMKFSHNSYFSPVEDLPVIVTSYHPSRQNTQTGRLTQEMFDAVWQRVKLLLENENA